METILFIQPINNGIINFVPFHKEFKSYPFPEHFFKPTRNKFLCGDQTGSCYIPGQCPMCDCLYEDIYLKEIQESFLAV